MSDTELDLEPLTIATPSSTEQVSDDSPRPAADAADGTDLKNARRSRTVTRIQPGFLTPEGAGARVSRSIGLPSLWNLSPFLILDYCEIEPGQGFPDHPHRGMATVTLVLDGQVTHEDHLGHSGTLNPGDLQWMIAGRGLVHSEMPQGSARALQLWIDLPAAKKMMKPRYVDRKSAQIPTVPLGDDGSARLIAGELDGAKGAVRETVNEVLLLDATLKGSTWIPLEPGWTTFVYVISGSFTISGREIKAQECAVLSAAEGQNGLGVEGEGRFVLGSSPPLQQELVMQGPFAVTTNDAAKSALRDFRDGRNGFEKALGWRSESGQSVGKVVWERSRKVGRGERGRVGRGRKDGGETTATERASRVGTQRPDIVFGTRAVEAFHVCSIDL